MIGIIAPTGGSNPTSDRNFWSRHQHLRDPDECWCSSKMINAIVENLCSYMNSVPSTKREKKSLWILLTKIGWMSTWTVTPHCAVYSNEILARWSVCRDLEGRIPCVLRVLSSSPSSPSGCRCVIHHCVEGADSVCQYKQQRHRFKQHAPTPEARLSGQGGFENDSAINVCFTHAFYLI